MTELHNILPKDLEETFHSLDYDQEGGLTVDAVKYLNNEMHFDFSLFLGDIEQNETQLWQLQVLNYRDSKIDIDNLGGYFNFFSDHFLLWEFIDNETELYFKNGTDNPEKLLADIYSIHNSTFENYIPLEKFVNGNNLLTQCKSNNGLFGRGPKRILNYYFDSLNKAGKEPYFYGDYIAKKWDGEKWVPEDKNLKVALLGGTYFVGQDFKFKRLDK
jgi:hypothetical protein